MRIWGKNLSNNKIVTEYVYKIEGDFDVHKFNDYISFICDKLDIASPVILIKHIKNFLLFNSITFYPDDFIESYKYEKFVIELLKN